MDNLYGLDDHYFRGKLLLIARDVHAYTPKEMVEELSKLLEVAKHAEKKLEHQRG